METGARKKPLHTGRLFCCASFNDGKMRRFQRGLACGDQRAVDAGGAKAYAEQNKQGFCLVSGLLLNPLHEQRYDGSYDDCHDEYSMIGNRSAARFSRKRSTAYLPVR
jgi:hypothetical protein